MSKANEKDFLVEAKARNGSEFQFNVSEYFRRGISSKSITCRKEFFQKQAEKHQGATNE